MALSFSGASLRGALPGPIRQSAGQTIAPRQPLATNRAIVGGLLIALSALGTFALASGVGGDDRSPFVVASRDLPPGTKIKAGDLTTVRLPLAGTVAAAAFSEPGKIVGATSLGPIRAGELVQGGAVVFKASGAAQPEMSFALPAARAVGGDLRSGETVDVLVTKKNSEVDIATVAVTDARVIKVQGGNNGLGRNGEVTITVALNSREEAAVLAAALDGSSVTLERTTGVSVTAR